MPPEFPSNTNTKTTSGYNPSAVKEVHRLSSNLLEKNGWKRDGMYYTKGEDIIVYDGVHWTLNGSQRIEFIEDINKQNG